MEPLSLQTDAIREFHDALAPRYDESFSSGGSGDRIRRKIQDRLAEQFPPGSHILELNCGTGTDALFLASRGVHVTATDLSQNMLTIAEGKARTASAEQFITTSAMDIRDVDRFSGAQFDGVFSNFNGLNYLPGLEGLPEKIASAMKPNAPLLLTLLNKVCFSEALYFAARLQPARVLRRATARARELEQGMGPISLRLYFPRQVTRMFSASFIVRRITGFGIFLAPAGFQTTSTKFPRAFRALESIEERVSARYPFYNWSDHYLIEFIRRDHI